ncbi:MAG: SoxR reducing system RseC family protein [Planctomycetaceae bacterium]|nr:SoxR reducing system RseC family protein [Planctomycetaceae bacterium]
MQEETIQDAVVLSVDNDRVMVRMAKEEDCGGCRSCALKNLCHKESDHLDLPVRLEDGVPPPQPGETVRVGYRAANAAAAAFIMFLPALVGLFFGGFAVNRYWGEGDGLFLVGCFAGLGLGLVVTFAISRLSTALRPEIRLLH